MTQLEHHVQHAIARQAALRADRAMADHGEGGFNWITGADALPMLSWEVKECPELSPIFLQAQRRLRIFEFIDFDEQIKGLVCIVLGLSLPHVVDRVFGLWLRQLGQAVEHVHLFVLPTPLLAGRGIDLIQCRPKPHGTVSDSQLGGIHPSAFEVEQNLAPTLCGLANPILPSRQIALQSPAGQ